jgi:predicted dehydrogenase
MRELSVGVIGMGMMGSTHLDVYGKMAGKGVRIAAVADIDPDRLHGRNQAAGNVPGQAAGGVDLSKAKRYAEGMQLIVDPEVEVVDICLPTPLHFQFTEAALKVGKHVLVEKPLCRTAADAKKLAASSAKVQTLAMPAMCMRFWPGWTWLKQTIDKKTFGNVLAAHFRRVASHPGGSFYSDGDKCGGAILDLHIHDTDFVQWCFGVPAQVFSRGYSKITNAIDHVSTQYIFTGKDAPPLVMAEGGWAFEKGFNFTMQYTVQFEKATALFDLAGSPALKLLEAGQEPRGIDLSPEMGYMYEIEYFLDCIRHNRKPATVTLADAANSVAIVEAEVKSIASGNVEAVKA